MDENYALGNSIEAYQVLNLIGKGGFASVYRARSVKNQMEVAVKMIDKKLMQAAGMVKRVRQEVSIHYRLKHPSILELYTFFEDENYVYLVLEICHRGELNRYLKVRGSLSEDEARSFLRQIVEGMIYLHSHNILHRDLTLSNLLLTKSMRVKIADFGLATQLAWPEEKHMTMCGTPNYISPEIATRSSHGLEADVWSLGCMLYTFLVGKPPFDTAAVQSTLTRVVMSDYELPEHLSVEACSLIDSLLKKNPKERLKLNEVLSHPFMNKYIGCSDKLLTQNSTDSGMGTMTTVSSSRSTNATRQGYSRPLIALPITELESQRSSECVNISNSSSLRTKCSGNAIYRHNVPTRETQSPTSPVRLRPGHGDRYPCSQMGGSLEQLKTKISTLPSVGVRSDKTEPYHQETVQVLQHYGGPPRRERDASEERRRQEKGGEKQVASQLTRAVFTGELRKKLYGEEKNELVYLSAEKGNSSHSCNPHDNWRKISDTNEAQHSQSSRSTCGHCHVDGFCSETTVQCINQKHFHQNLNNISCHSASCHGSSCDQPLRSELNGQEVRRLEKVKHSTCSHHWQCGGRDNCCSHLETCGCRTSDHSHFAASLCKNRSKVFKESCHMETCNDDTTSKPNIHPKYGKHSEGQDNLSSPLNTKRLRSTRQRTKNAVVHILENGEVCVEFIRCKNQEEKVTDVCRISPDGMRVIIYKPNGGKGCPITSSPAVIPQSGADNIFSYESLPQKHYKKYIYAARFVKLVRAKTPKITFYSSQAKCMLMENSPTPDFEVSFYKGGKITFSGGSTKIIDVTGKAYSLNYEEELEGLPSSIQILCKHFSECHQHCQDLEAALSATETRTSQQCFPVIIGRRPSAIPSSVQNDKENYLLREKSGNPSVLHPLSTDFYEASKQNSSRLDEKFNDTQVQSSVGRSGSHKTPSSGQSSCSQSEIIRSVFIPHMGWASQLLSGDVWLQCTDGTQLKIPSSTAEIQFTDISGKKEFYNQDDILPDRLKEKLAQLPHIVNQLVKSGSVKSTHSYRTVR
ncbi:LOW QUALITY PROTEIN: serine/threonine-protein kinase PLK4-like [Tachypleus tridentatus]|uniref:LOW QUALITY PROTEIN: serine/threonine-protein kinase PLK4-like n=1 Tax=Tachypleus tridentatus TaxID=6853 RepID=UPI003FD0BFFA